MECCCIRNSRFACYGMLLYTKQQVRVLWNVAVYETFPIQQRICPFLLLYTKHQVRVLWKQRNYGTEIAYLLGPPAATIV
jgi:hypothetical protein